MSSRNLSAVYNLPPDCIVLEFPRSDGDPDGSTWPQNRTENVDKDGHVNWYKQIPDNEGASLRWKHQAAMKVAEKMNKECTYKTSLSVTSP